MLGHMQAFIADMFEIIGTAERPFFTDGFAGHNGMIIIQQYIRFVEIGFA